MPHIHLELKCVPKPLCFIKLNDFMRSLSTRFTFTTVDQPLFAIAQETMSSKYNRKTALMSFSFSMIYFNKF